MIVYYDFIKTKGYFNVKMNSQFNEWWICDIVMVLQTAVPLHLAFFGTAQLVVVAQYTLTHSE